MTTSALRDAARSAGVGRLLYKCWHQPAHELRDLVLDGGPANRKRTEEGKREMERACATLPPSTPPAGDERIPEVYFLSGRRFWPQTAYCILSMLATAPGSFRPVVHDDGSIDEALSGRVLELFPWARIVGDSEARQRLDEHLPVSRFPHLRESRERQPHVRKLVDLHAGGTGWKLYLDSDILFFAEWKEIYQWMARPERPLVMQDVRSSYGYSRKALEEVAGAGIPNRVNVGALGLRSEDVDFERLEHWLDRLKAREGSVYYTEQALVAAELATTPHDVLDGRRYRVLPDKREARARRAVCHHYVAHSKRWYFQENWRRIDEQCRQS